MRERWRLRQVPPPVVDAGLAATVAAAVAIPIVVSPERGGRRDLAAYAVGLVIAVLVLARRRWPLGVLVATAVVLQAYYVVGLPGIFPAVPLSVALATAWAAG